MPDLVIAVIVSVFRALRGRRDLVLENLALRHKLAVLNMAIIVLGRGGAAQAARSLRILQPARHQLASCYFATRLAGVERPYRSLAKTLIAYGYAAPIPGSSSPCSRSWASGERTTKFGRDTPRAPRSVGQTGACCERMGGMLNYDYRRAA